MVVEADANISSSPQGGLADSDSSNAAANVGRLAADMQQRCRLFLDELEQFQAYLKGERKENQAELRTFKAGLQSEMNTHDKVSIDLHSTAMSVC
jgi:uncharacterized protein involved in exopolysaccharide biosynthesis